MQGRQCKQILLGLRWEADHEIELYAVPACLKRILCGAQQVFFLHSLVDDVTQTLGSGFRRKC